MAIQNGHPGAHARRALWLAAAALCLLAGFGCDKFPRKAGAVGRAAKGEAPGQNATLDSGQVLQAARPFLAVIETTWEERPAVVGLWKGRGQLGTGVLVASDGRMALVLTNRQMVDPRYKRSDAPRTRNTLFRVSTPAQRTAGQSQFARLVALYMNEGDLALLQIPAPSPEPLAIPLADSGGLRAGDKVTIIGAPTGEGFVLSEGLVSNFWQQSPTAGKTLQVSVPAGPASTVGPVFWQKGGRLAGIMRSQLQSDTPPGVGFATPVDHLRTPDYWDYLMSEDSTRQLLKALR